MRSAIIALFSLALVACGSSPTDRVVGGSAIGALAGTAVGAATNVSMAHGLLIGAAAGAITGAVTREDQINLGVPPWSRERHAAATQTAPGRGTVESIQLGLRREGLYAGSIDGVAGPMTRNAIRAYQERNGLLVDGRASRELAAHIEAKT